MVRVKIDISTKRRNIGSDICHGKAASTVSSPLVTKLREEWELPNQWSKDSSVVKPIIPMARPKDLQLTLIKQHVSWWIRAMEDGYGLSPVDENLIGRIAELWQCASDKIPVEKVAKWFYASGSSFVTDQELPPSPLASGKKFLYLAGVGRVRQFMRALFKKMRFRYMYGNFAAKQRALTFSHVFGQLKKGSPVVQTAVVEKAVAEHKQGLGSRAHLPPQKKDKKIRGTIEEYLSSPPSPGNRQGYGSLNQIDADNIDDAIKSVVKEIFGGKRFKAGKAVCPSISGHYDSSTKRGGAMPVIMKNLRVNEGSELQRMDFHPKLGVLESRDEYVYSIDLDEELLRGRPPARPTFLKEPLKVRPVTSGPSRQYFMLLDVQKYMWKCLAEHPTFMVDHPISLDDIESFSKLNPFSKVISGDYKGSTDNLCSWLSRAIYNEICRVGFIPDYFRRMGMKALIGHALYYKDGDVINQSNGQLMGSTMSFPILCVANAVLCKLAYHYSLPGESNWVGPKFPMKLRDIPLKVNGDDCILGACSAIYEAWKAWTKLGGLEPSVGKVYFAEWFLQMNSVNYMRNSHYPFAESSLRTDEFRRECKFADKWRRVPTINFGLTSEFECKGGERRHWSCLSELGYEFAGAQEGEIVSGIDLCALFIKRQRKLINEAPKEISWFLPKFLGGLGLPFDHEVTVTHDQQRLASYLYEKAQEGDGFSFPLEMEKPSYLTKAQKRLMPYREKVEKGGWTWEWKDPSSSNREIKFYKKTLFNEVSFRTETSPDCFPDSPVLTRVWNPLLEEDTVPGELWMKELEEKRQLIGNPFIFHEASHAERFDPEKAKSGQNRWYKVWKASKKFAQDKLKSVEFLLHCSQPKYEVPSHVVDCLHRVYGNFRPITHILRVQAELESFQPDGGWNTSSGRLYGPGTGISYKFSSGFREFELKANPNESKSLVNQSLDADLTCNSPLSDPFAGLREALAKSIISRQTIDTGNSQASKA